jgi:hypothetical protein
VVAPPLAKLAKKVKATAPGDAQPPREQRVEVAPHELKRCIEQAFAVRSAPGGELTDDRQAEKQASRDADAEALASGTKTREQLRAENGLVRISRIDFASVRAPR